MELSPFPFPGPLPPEAVVGRDEVVDDLVERLTARRVTALVGPRRYGKTSVLGKVAEILRGAGSSVVWVDLYEVRSMADVAMRLDTALSESDGRIRRALREITATLEVKLGFVNVEFARRRNEQPDPVATVHLLLDALVRAATATPTTIVFDEFAGIVAVDGAAGLLRTKLQHHFETIGLVFAGSQPSLMQWMFTAPSQPFYAQADLVTITPFDAATTERIVADGFAATGRDAGGAAAAIQRFTGGHPYRTMQLADAVWQRTPPGGAADAGIVSAAIGDLRHRSAPANETLFSAFNPAERGVLRLIASNRPLYGAARELLDLASSSVTSARERLAVSGTIDDRRDGAPSVVDPVLADWIRTRLPI